MIGDILSLIESAREGGNLSNEQANLIEFVANLKDQDSQVLANRAIARGADPFAIQLLATGRVEDYIRSAHTLGPGLLEGKERDEWLFLAALSSDEHADIHKSVRERMTELSIAVDCYRTFDTKQRQDAIENEEEKIAFLAYNTEQIQGIETKVYTADLGFASAYWNGNDHAAVRQPDGATFVGSKSIPLVELGFDMSPPNKSLSPTFGIIFPPKKRDLLSFKAPDEWR